MEKLPEKRPAKFFPADSVMSESQMIEYRKTLDYVIFKSYELGWINCDEELENVNNTTLKISADIELNPTFRLLFPSIKAAAHPKLENGKYVFYNIPKNQQAILIGYSLLDDKYYFSYSEISIKPDETIEQSLIATDREEIENRVKKISWLHIIVHLKYFNI